jgi:hypothetical protein
MVRSLPHLLGRGPLALPDALVLATGDVLDATVVTADRTWPRLSRRLI